MGRKFEGSRFGIDTEQNLENRDIHSRPEIFLLVVIQFRNRMTVGIGDDGEFSVVPFDDVHGANLAAMVLFEQERLQGVFEFPDFFLGKRSLSDRQTGPLSREDRTIGS